jgi:hypothetical protein
MMRESKEPGDDLPGSFCLNGGARMGTSQVRLKNKLRFYVTFPYLWWI